jgi:division protein CdvB (Snf7/Vps24/ESCRT-III family)
MTDEREKLKAEKEEVEKLIEEATLDASKLSEALNDARKRLKALERQHQKILQELAGQQKLFN